MTTIDEAMDAPLIIDFDIDTSDITIGDVEIIEDALRTLLIDYADSDDLSPEYKGAIVKTLAKVEKWAKPKPKTHERAVLTGGIIPAHVPGAYPDLSCCGGTKVRLVPE